MSLAAWLRLTLISGVGGESQRKLLSAFGLPEEIFAASRLALRGIVGDRTADLLLDTEVDESVNIALAWAEQPDCRIITLADPEYPQQLFEIADPPVLLYARGNAALLKQPGLAIVGSRNGTPQGLQTARAFARAIGDAGWNVVSGLALGIDAAAHEGALESTGKTIAVIGTGADRLYPARNRDLALAIAARGLILSDFPLGTPALAANFPRRNRLIAGLSRGVLVVEAAPQSGSLITARLAAEQGREVFAIPGSIHSPHSKGCHQLIKQGAKLVETVSDILDEFGSAAVPSAADDSPCDCDPVLQAIGHDPCPVDILAQRCGLPIDQLLARLLDLELAGQIATLPGGLVQRLAQNA